MSILNILGLGGDHKNCKEISQKMDAVSRSQATIEFDLSGNILTANQNFCDVMGYHLNEIVGQHHSIFIDQETKNSAEYREFWENLRRGVHSVKEFKRIAKSGKTVWIQASYNPLLDDDGKPYKVVKFATDITANKQNADLASALKLCQANVILVNNDLEVVYLNNVVGEMLQRNEKSIADVMHKFSVRNLIGARLPDILLQDKADVDALLSLKQPYEVDLNIGSLIFGLIASPWLSGDGSKLGVVVELDDKTERVAKQREEKRVAAENERIKQALDNTSANVMIADPDANIIYLNKAVQEMMSGAESDIKRDLPHFDASKLIGTNIDGFHKNPSHQRNLLKDLKTAYQGKAIVGGRTFIVIANPVFRDGERVGTVVEWEDKTSELRIEAEIDDMVQAAGLGDFTKQLSIDGKSGFFLNLGKGLNNLVSTVEVALNDILRMLGAMSRGDLSERVTREYQGAFGQLKDDANTTADKLTEIISKIRVASNSIATSAEEIAQGNADLSQRTEEQASSLEETASSMEEMTSTVKQSSENAQEAKRMALETQTRARDGGDIVKRAVSAMEEINNSSKRISDIIGVIDEIAFQTNLLALNAAVEAARAGEQGRGFAVVAGEVRNLAQRSAGAAKEIKDLIRDSVSKVEDGASLVNQSGDTLSEIVRAVDEVTVMMQEIASAAQEQTSGIEQVNTAVTQMDEMTQQNAALVEEASAAGQAMSDQAKSMNKVVEFFSISNLGAGATSSPSSFSERRPLNPASKAPPVMRHTASSSSSDEEWEDF
ncbi:Methyl-accepting chemotaxis protein II [Thalassocella blandensis]|nr:Methyl-accepting chemotaxis protein II [Thalassocella blandensis]